jgi:hypothetical protein
MEDNPKERFHSNIPNTTDAMGWQSGYLWLKSSTMRLLFLFFLLPSTFLFAQDTVELPAITTNSNNFFIPEALYQKHNMEKGESDAWMKVFTSRTIGTDSGLQRVNDIRWQAKDKAGAIQWYKANRKLLSEDAQDITNQVSKPAGVDSWNVYTQSKEMSDLMKSMGIGQNHYNFTFTVDKYVAKIFVATSVKQTVKDAWQFAKEGLKAILTAAGKPELAKLVL